MEVEIDDRTSYLLAVLAEQDIKIPAELFHDLMDGRLGSLNSAAALAKVTAELFEKMPAEKVDFPDIFDTLFEATRDALAELEAEWRARWKYEYEERAARMVGIEQLVKRRRQAEKRKAKRGGKRKRRAA